VALRFLNVFVPNDKADEVIFLVEDLGTEGAWKEDIGDGLARVQTIVRSENAENVTDRLSDYFSTLPGFRIVILPVEASLPMEEEKEEKPKKTAAPVRDRVSREELYEDVSEGTRPSAVFLVTVALSSVVAAIGLANGDTAVVIGAMVIAPLLKPNVALSLACTLGDYSLAFNSIKTSVTGVAAAGMIAVVLGFVLRVDPAIPEIAARTTVSLGNVVLALAAGSAGALAFTTGVPAALIGVMVAVALLPPLVASGLLLGAGKYPMAYGAFLLTLTNIACVNLAGIVTFLVQGIHPRRWAEEESAKKSTAVAMAFWLGAVLLLGLLILLQRG